MQNNTKEKLILSIPLVRTFNSLLQVLVDRTNGGAAKGVVSVGIADKATRAHMRRIVGVATVSTT